GGDPWGGKARLYGDRLLDSHLRGNDGTKCGGRATTRMPAGTLLHHCNSCRKKTPLGRGGVLRVGCGWS
ncbi:MAG: hypothetical protein ACK5GA_04605, partial [Holosporaceae bacterium]